MNAEGSYLLSQWNGAGEVEDSAGGLAAASLDSTFLDRAANSVTRTAHPPPIHTAPTADIMTDQAIQIAETIQTASINRHPSPAHDANPSTSASLKQPVRLDDEPDLDQLPSDIDEDEIPVSVLRPTPRNKQFPPLPDLRFEQSYLASIQNADTWQKVAWITFRDQVFMPLTQGLLWTLVVAGWRNWNSKSTSFSGSSVGARLRRWWWKTNNWTIPRTLRDDRLAAQAKEVTTVSFFHLSCMLKPSSSFC